MGGHYKSLLHKLYCNYEYLCHSENDHILEGCAKQYLIALNLHSQQPGMAAYRAQGLCILQNYATLQYCIKCPQSTHCSNPISVDSFALSASTYNIIAGQGVSRGYSQP